MATTEVDLCYVNRLLSDEIDKYDKINEEKNEEKVEKKVKDFKKTSLNKCIKIFQEFITVMLRESKKQNRENDGMFIFTFFFSFNFS